MEEQENKQANELSPQDGSTTAPAQGAGQTIIINQSIKTNGMGIAGFVLALIGLFLCWVPVFGWIVWALGLLFSFIGVFKAPRSLAIAGLVVSIAALIPLVFFAAAIAALLSC